jgi:hypothetical protein
MKHTPGPWKAELIEHRPAYSKRERREEMDYEWIVEPVTIYPAECVTDGVKHPHFTVARLPYGDATHPHAEANARLIAAAPDLLAALKATLHLSLEMKGTKNLAQSELSAIQDAKAAIQKAEGGA